ncbi:MAG: ChbG/HpnK family deacetylase [Proteobacteria bacterium]|nr:ChbG/HpnK family deacetylase [Pseudomonadota bacterium]
MKKVIINADDLFLNDRINEGIGELIDAGIVTSVSVIVNMNYSPEKLKEFYKEHPNASYGLHVNLTEGYPVSDISEVRSLVNRRGRFYNLKNFIFRVHLMKPGEIIKEIDGQIELFKKSEVPLLHIDSHSHVFWLSSEMRRIQMEIAIKYGIPTRYPEVTDVNNRSILFKLLRLYLKLHRNNMARRVKMPDALIDLFGRGDTADFVKRNTENIKDGISELLTHPGYACCGGFMEREMQLKLLKSDWFRELLMKNGLKLCNFSELRGKR